MIKKLIWNLETTVPPQLGYDKNIGLAGMIYGNIGDYLIFGGGSNFPNGSPIEGGKKIEYSDIYLYKQVDNTLVLMDQIQFSYPFSYGASTTTDDTLYFITKKNNTESDIVALTVSHNKLQFSILDTIAYSLENIILEYYNNTLIFGVGTVAGTLSTALYSYDLETKIIHNLGDFPGNKRSQALSFLHQDSLIIYGGGADLTYFDGFKFDLVNKTWSKLSDIGIADKDNNTVHFSLLGSRWLPINECELLTLGGFNKDIWRWAVHNLSTLKGDYLEEFRTMYFSMDEEEYKWNREILVYNHITDSWRLLDFFSFSAPCGHGFVKINDTLYSIMGEVKPAKRTNKIFSAKIKAL